ncbi:MAG: CinA family nicotinamide mononucleotide deamidase-related protein [Verrucomicrobia bacterium]|nr:CinA family nicotinamide mononucleotide deamidase-related protein [Verrucomicrobiota bacterium]MCH8526743.1 CinA family nicotinamide mononucleotide deamidase-related protein [Kiritimatiellia bacterium]
MRTKRRIAGSEVIATGAELLQGRTLNRHGYTLGALLVGAGIPLLRETVVPDDIEQIREAVAAALKRVELVFVTGGLGPTEDDVTREAVALATGRAVVSHAEADAHLQAYFARINREPTAAQCQQARVLAGAEVFMNPVGIAPGQCLTLEGGRSLWLLPGPPRELNGLIETALAPWLSEQVERADMHQRVFRILGHSESRVQERLRTETEIPAEVAVAYCARPGSVELRFHGPEAAVDLLTEWVRERYAEDLLNETGEAVEAVVGRLLLERGETLATAESCTAGGIAERVTDVPGSSGYFVGGVVAYANGVKVRELGVDAAVLEREGAVSEAVAQQMAAGVRARLKTTWGLSITGVAGPGGGTPEKPVGLFYVGLANAERACATRFQVNGDRQQIRDHGIQRALEVLWHSIR